MHFVRGSDRGVSPVIGTILLVAVVVVLATITAPFALGLGENVSDPAPSVALDAEETENGTVTMTHVSGEAIDSKNFAVKGGEVNESSMPETIEPGSTVEVDPDSDADEVAFIWQKAGQSSMLLQTPVSSGSEAGGPPGNEQPPTDDVQPPTEPEGVQANYGGFGVDTTVAIDFDTSALTNNPPEGDGPYEITSVEIEYEYGEGFESAPLSVAGDEDFPSQARTNEVWLVDGNRLPDPFRVRFEMEANGEPVTDETIGGGYFGENTSEWVYAVFPSFRGGTDPKVKFNGSTGEVWVGNPADED